jgi:hypothetical protein
MNFPHFLRIERDERRGARHFVVHLAEPKFSLELAPDAAAPDRLGRGVLKRVCVPNSWAGDYGQYAQHIGAAQDFFAEASAARAGAAGGRLAR